MKPIKRVLFTSSLALILASSAASATQIASGVGVVDATFVGATDLSTKAFFPADADGQSPTLNKVETLVTSVFNVSKKQFATAVSTIILKGRRYIAINLEACPSYKNGGWNLSAAESQRLQSWAGQLSPGAAEGYDDLFGIVDPAAQSGTQPLTFSSLNTWGKPRPLQLILKRQLAPSSSGRVEYDGQDNEPL